VTTSASPRRRGALGLGISALALVTVLGMVAAALVWWNGGVGPLVGREQCTVSANGDQVSLAPEQAGNASTITLEALRRGLPERAVTVALATAYQESDLFNLPHGDRDSAGLFQQRPSQGWGSFEQITDPQYAASRFYEALVQVPNWQNLAVTQAAQAVQRSAFPDAYQQHADEAKVLAAAFTGDEAASVTCTVRAESVSLQREQDSGLTPRAQRLRAAITAAFGDLPMGGFAPGGVERANPSAHNDGRAIDVFFRPYDDPQQRRSGWVLAHWLVAHADELDLAVVIFDDHIWSAARSPEGWRPYTSPFGNAKDPVNRHLDHVHVDVVAGVS
jgi:hypothetical protein